jgi:hypothetical protein
MRKAEHKTLAKYYSSCNQLRKIKIKEEMLKNCFTGIEDINTCILFYIMYRFVQSLIV